MTAEELQALDARLDAIKRRLGVSAASMLEFMLDTFEDKGVPDGVRLEIAKFLLERISKDDFL